MTEAIITAWKRIATAPATVERLCIAGDGLLPSDVSFEDDMTPDLLVLFKKSDMRVKREAARTVRDRDAIEHLASLDDSSVRQNLANNRHVPNDIALAMLFLALDARDTEYLRHQRYSVDANALSSVAARNPLDLLQLDTRGVDKFLALGRDRILDIVFPLLQDLGLVESRGLFAALVRLAFAPRYRAPYTLTELCEKSAFPACVVAASLACADLDITEEVIELLLRYGATYDFSEWRIDHGSSYQVQTSYEAVRLLVANYSPNLMNIVFDALNTFHRRGKGCTAIRRATLAKSAISGYARTTGLATDGSDASSFLTVLSSFVQYAKGSPRQISVVWSAVRALQDRSTELDDPDGFVELGLDLLSDIVHDDVFEDSDLRELLFLRKASRRSESTTASTFDHCTADEAQAYRTVAFLANANALRAWMNGMWGNVSDAEACDELRRLVSDPVTEPLVEALARDDNFRPSVGSGRGGTSAYLLYYLGRGVWSRDLGAFYAERIAEVLDAELGEHLDAAELAVQFLSSDWNEGLRELIETCLALSESTGEL